MSLPEGFVQIDLFSDLDLEMDPVPERAPKSVKRVEACLNGAKKAREVAKKYEIKAESKSKRSSRKKKGVMYRCKCGRSIEVDIPVVVVVCGCGRKMQQI